LESTQRLLDSAITTEVDWDNAPALSTEVFTSTIQYDALGRAAKNTDPGGHEHHYIFARSGALQQVKLDGTIYVQDIVHDAKGQRQAIWYGNGTKTSYTYDPFTYSLRRLLTLKLSTNDILQDLNYVYDPSGNITRISDAAQQTLFFDNTVVSPDQVFTYDALYRLIKAEGREQKGTNDFDVTDNFTDASWKVAHKGDGAGVQRYTQYYTYDEVGNILELQHSAGTASYTRTYTYSNSHNRLLSTTVGSDTYTYTHDVRGNMGALPHLNSMAWNHHNELASVVKGTDTTYYQYGGGQRIRKHTIKGTIAEERIYLGDYEIYRKFDNSSLICERETLHVSDDSGRIAMLENRTYGTAADDNNTAATLIRYVYSNHLQSASLELDENAAIISYEEYHPYGTTSYQAVNASINAVAKRYRYTGKERDEESGLYYHGARYYIPWLCRWTAVDPLEAKFAGMSPYNYAFNNPVMWNDLSGAAPGDEDKTNDFKHTTPGGDFHPIGMEKDLEVIRDDHYRDSGGMGFVQQVHDKSNGKNYSIFRYLNSQKYYSWINATTGQAEIFYGLHNNTKNKDANGHWNGYWQAYYTAEQQAEIDRIETEKKIEKQIQEFARETMSVVPFVGGGLDIVEGLNDGNVGQVASGAVGLALDVFGGTIFKAAAAGIKGVVKTGIKEGAEIAAKEGAEVATKELVSIVKQDEKILKYAKETFEGNEALRKEANSLIEQLNKGNMNPGIGTKNIGKGIFEARSRNGARIYFRNNSKIEILGYSHKGNQQNVINQIMKIYGK